MSRRNVVQFRPISGTDRLADYPPDTPLLTYARKSTPQFGDAESKSTTRQLDNGARFAMDAFGLPVLDSFGDEEISGGDTDRMVERNRLYATLARLPRPAVVVMRDTSRFSRRDGDEAFTEMKALAQTGVDVWFYGNRTKFKYGTLADDMGAITERMMAREYRRQISTWVHEAFRRKAEQGHVTGRPTYGYRNERRGPRHVVRVIDDAEAAIVKRIYTRASEHAGAGRIARELNADGIVGPMGRPWKRSAVRYILANPMYRGESIWNKTHGRNAADRRQQVRAAQSEWIHTQIEELRIVDDATWHAVQQSRQGRADKLRAVPTWGTGGNWRDRDSAYLGVGHYRCGSCGARMKVVTPSSGSRHPIYACRASRDVCPNASTVPVEVLDQAVIDAIVTAMKQRPTLERDLQAAVRKELAPAQIDRAALKTEVAKLERAQARLVEAVKSAPGVTALAHALTDGQRRINALERRLAAPVAHPRSMAEIERRVAREFQTRRDLLFQGMAEKRAFLADVLSQPIRITAIGEPPQPWQTNTYAFSFEGTLDFQRIAGFVHSGPLGRQSATTHEVTFQGTAAGKAA